MIVLLYVVTCLGVLCIEVYKCHKIYCAGKTKAFSIDETCSSVKV